MRRGGSVEWVGGGGRGVVGGSKGRCQVQRSAVFASTECGWMSLPADPTPASFDPQAGHAPGGVARSVSVAAVYAIRRVCQVLRYEPASIRRRTARHVCTPPRLPLARISAVLTLEGTHRRRAWKERALLSGPRVSRASRAIDDLCTGLSIAPWGLALHPGAGHIGNGRPSKVLSGERA